MEILLFSRKSLEDPFVLIEISYAFSKSARPSTNMRVFIVSIIQGSFVIFFFTLFLQGISTAASNTTLAENIDQQRIYKLKETTTRNNGTILKRAGKATKISSEAVKELKTSAKVEYDLKNVDYYNFDIAVENKVRLTIS